MWQFNGFNLLIIVYLSDVLCLCRLTTEKWWEKKISYCAHKTLIFFRKFNDTFTSFTRMRVHLISSSSQKKLKFSTSSSSTLITVVKSLWMTHFKNVGKSFAWFQLRLLLLTRYNVDWQDSRRDMTRCGWIKAKTRHAIIGVKLLEIEGIVQCTLILLGKSY